MDKRLNRRLRKGRRNAIWRALVKLKVTVATKKSHREIPARKRNTEYEAMKEWQMLKNSCTNYSRTVTTTWSLQREHTLWNNCKKMMLRKIWREEVQKKFLWKYQTKITGTNRMPAFWDTCCHPIVTYTGDSHQIPSQNKTKLQILNNWQNFKFQNFAKKRYRAEMGCGPDGRTHRRTDRWSENPPTTSLCRGII